VPAVVVTSECDEMSEMRGFFAAPSGYAALFENESSELRFGREFALEAVPASFLSLDLFN
jgi:hypothetical protein